eukprot:scaffold4537_cov144-Isochrysis_galbana.AAC.6
MGDGSPQASGTRSRIGHGRGGATPPARAGATRTGATTNPAAATGATAAECTLRGPHSPPLV